MRSLLLIFGSCAIFTASADEPVPAPPPQTALAAAPASLNTSAAASTSSAPASATASGGWVIRMVSPTAASRSSPPAATLNTPVAASTTATVPAHAEPTCEDVKVFKDKMHAAVDAALKYPAELKFHPTAGVTFVAYEYQDGSTENVHITQWSGDGRLDRAAVAAVKNANFAAITPGIGHTRIHDVVIIIYDNYKDNGGKNTKQQPQDKQFSQDCK